MESFFRANGVMLAMAVAVIYIASIVGLALAGYTAPGLMLTVPTLVSVGTFQLWYGLFHEKQAWGEIQDCVDDPDKDDPISGPFVAARFKFASDCWKVASVTRDLGYIGASVAVAAIWLIFKSLSSDEPSDLLTYLILGLMAVAIGLTFVIPLRQFLRTGKLAGEFGEASYDLGANVPIWDPTEHD